MFHQRIVVNCSLGYLPLTVFIRTLGALIGDDTRLFSSVMTRVIEVFLGVVPPFAKGATTLNALILHTSKYIITIIIFAIKLFVFVILTIQFVSVIEIVKLFLFNKNQKLNKYYLLFY